MFCGVGGSTVMWSAHAPRFHPSDFRVRSLDGVADDWPLTYEELVPYYDLNDRISGVSGLAGDPANPPRSARQTPPVPLGPGGERLADAFERLGWHWWPCDGHVITRPYAGRPACNNCGPCELGCPRGSKGSADVTYWPLALNAGARLLTRATVTEVTLDPAGRATGAAYVDESGVARHVRARSVVVAANGIGTPRLLLASTSALHPAGLANRSGLVGRNLMLHPIAAVTGVFDAPLRSFAGPDAFALFSQEFYETDEARGFVRGYTMQVTRGQGPLVTALGGYTLDVPWGRDHHARFEAFFGRVVTIAVCCEDLPRPENRVELSDTLADTAGVPGARMIYAPDENSRRMIEHGLARARDVLREAGAVELHERDVLPQAGFHLMGTARMGDDPERSVTDRYGRAHDVPNLFIADSSVFVTAAGVNPCPTIQALALRCADRIVATRRDLPDPWN
jgi:choline dehydrogenase-like flavoprotein